MTLGDKIKQMRIQKGLTQAQLGSKYGINEATIRRYENNRLNPKFSTVVKFAKELNVDPVWLFMHKYGDVTIGDNGDIFVHIKRENFNE